MIQGGGELRGPSSTTPGATIEVTVGTPDAQVFVSTGGGAPTPYPVQGGKVQIPVPQGVGPGQSFWVFVGSGANIKYLRVEVVQP